MPGNKYKCISELDLDLDTGGKLQRHERFHRLLGGGDDVDQALVGAALELLMRTLSGKKMLAYMRAYGPSYEFCRFYRITDENGDWYA